jgi:hypothetical protein
MTVVVDAVMRERDAAGDSARWRCSTSVDDVEAMTYLGFLYAGQASAADVMLGQAQDLLFGKTINPVAAAAGAYGLLTYSAETNARERPQWRDWIRNLYHWFPNLPDAAIAMAQMTLRSASSADEDIDVESCVTRRRRAPYLPPHVRHQRAVGSPAPLVSDDESQQRGGDRVDNAARACAGSSSVDSGAGRASPCQLGPT